MFSFLMCGGLIFAGLITTVFCIYTLDTAAHLAVDDFDIMVAVLLIISIIGVIIGILSTGIGIMLAFT